MAKVIGVKFKNSGKIYFFDSAGIDIKKDDHVIVETGMGIDYGYVVSGVREIDESKLFQPLKPIMRKANERDEQQVKDNEVKSKEAFSICLEKVKAHGLDMKLTEVEYAFDNSKILFYFTSDGYVDFRELVKDLAGTFRTRIELRQIGVRDEARAIGGLGACGRPMCCAAYLPDFVPVSIKMAKEQNLPLNPTKISGVCGRLMCCLKYEEETYEELNKTMPDVGDFVEGSDGLQGDVFSTNVLRQTVKVLVENGDEKEMHDYAAGDITILRKRKGKKLASVAKAEEEAEIKQLEALEDKPEKEDKKEKKSFDKGGKGDNAHRNEGHENRENRDNRDNRENRNGDNGVTNGDDRNKNDNKNDNKNENRNRNENRGDKKDRHFSKGDKKQKSEEGVSRENHNENRNDSRGDNRNENRNENRGEGHKNPRGNKGHKKNHKFHDKNKGFDNENRNGSPEN
ncbi:MAG: stage 0 sporulation family protein [Lachnospiraceae bacterium]|nr:stage 0 sporulation family protein [Lachnospiraceae bacterium]